MGANRRSKNLCASTLSILEAGESATVDFKKIPDGVSADDLVSFANSDGGEILVGVIEGERDGAQIGVVRGCDVSDHAILQITNKAISCIPPVSIDIFIENLDDKPILRIDIPTSRTKPHCTPKGVYCKRDGTRNRPIHPHELLRIFLDTEARVFSQRFEAAANRITDDLVNLENSLDSTIRSMGDQLGWASSQLDDTESDIKTILGLAHRIDERSGKLGSRMRELFRQDKRSDPVRDKEYKKLLNDILNSINERDDLVKIIARGGKINASASANLSEDLTTEDFEQALNRVVDFLHRRETLKQYSVICKAPSKCQKGELDAFITAFGADADLGPDFRTKLEGSFRLGFAMFRGDIVATSALRKSTIAYRKQVFKEAGLPDAAGDYRYQLDWIHLLEGHREKGVLTKLMDNLLPHGKETGIFAIPRVDDELMVVMLRQLKFDPIGQPFDTRAGSSEQKQLYLMPRSASTA
ncbi:RNA-binding domain-containing protein [Agrobacterium sp.]|uniref:AlbA family DNA-binding domain-containing protein n=1 Tax=Agrobacterium sp. TaxID=361 RepID=UPI0028ABE2BE